MSADQIWICTRRVSVTPLMEHAVWSMRIVCFFNVAGFIAEELNLQYCYVNRNETVSPLHMVSYVQQSFIFDA